MRAFCAVVLAACGRIDFDPLGNGGGSGTGDGGNAACAIATERCNGIDDNCNGVIDEGCTCTPFSQEIPSPVPATAGLAWTGDRYYLTTADTMNWSLITVDEALALQPGPVIGALSNIDFSRARRQIAWSGSRLGIAFTTRDTGQIWVGSVGASLQEVPIASQAIGSSAQIAWAGDRFVVAWGNSSDASIHLAELSDSLAPLSPELTVATGALQDLDVRGERYLVVASDASGLAAYLVDRTSHSVTPMTVRLTAGLFAAQGAGTPGGYAIASLGGGMGTDEIQFYDRAGVALGDKQSLPASTDGSAYAYGDLESRGGTYELYLAGSNLPFVLDHAVYDATGQLVAAPAQTTVYNTSSIEAPASELAGGRTGIVLFDDGDNWNEIRQFCP